MAPKVTTEQPLSTSCTAQPPQAFTAQSPPPSPHSTHYPCMKIIDEMFNLDLLTHEQHQQISAWIARSTSPEEILQMPAPLWQAVERASQTMGINEDLLRPPSLDLGGVVLG